MVNTTNRVKLPYILQSQSQKEVTHNAALDLIDALIQAAMVDISINTPPGSPSAGDCYIVGSSPTGAWTGQANAVAFYTTSWNFITPFKGMTVWVDSQNLLYTWSGTAWILTFNPTSFANLTMLGVNATADSTNKLSVSSSAILFNNIGTDIQVKLNKGSSGSKASLTFQDGFSERAEFGLLGDDNFTLKVSPDGSTFFNALKMLAASGRMAVKANASGLSAAGTTQGTATAITNQTNEFTTVGSGQGGILPSPEQGEFIFVANAGANALLVYPASGHSINALSANTAFSLAAGKNAMFWAATSSKWYVNLTA